MGTTKLKSLSKSLLLYRRETKKISGKVLKQMKGEASQKHATTNKNRSREGLGHHLDIHLKSTLDKNAELIIKRKIEEELEDNLAFIFK